MNEVTLATTLQVHLYNGRIDLARYIVEEISKLGGDTEKLNAVIAKVEELTIVNEGLQEDLIQLNTDLRQAIAFQELDIDEDIPIAQTAILITKGLCFPEGVAIDELDLLHGYISVSPYAIAVIKLELEVAANLRELHAALEGIEKLLT